MLVALGHPGSSATGTRVDPDEMLTVVINDGSTVPLMYSKEDSLNSDWTDTATLPTGPIVMLLFDIVTAVPSEKIAVASRRIPVPPANASRLVL